MRTIKTLAGTPFEPDGDVLLVIETIYRDLTTRHGLSYNFEDVDREIQHVIAQMQDDELRTYLKESLFMSFNRYDNERLLAVVQRASLARSDKGTGQRAQGREQRAQGKGQRAEGRGQRAKGKGQREKKKIQKGGRQARARRTARVSRSNRVRRRR